MKAAVLTEYGGADKLQVRDIPEPTAGANEIKVRVGSASINPIDWKVRSGAFQAYIPLKLPAVLGRDAAGVVVAVGPGVTAFEPGARVLGLVDQGYAELVVAQVEGWAPLPDALDVTDAGAVPLVALTGVQLAEEAVDVRAGQRLLVTGALGGVGRAALFAALGRGAEVYAGVRRHQKADAARLGAAGVVALDDDGDLANLPELDAVADSVGGDAVKRVMARVKPGGRWGSAVGEPPDAKARGLSVRPMHTHPDPRRLGELAAAVAEGKLVIPIVRRFPLAEVRAAHELAERGAGGKVLLIP